MNEFVWMRVPRDLAVDLHKIAEKKGITARGKWAVYARMVLIAHLQDVNYYGKEASE
jgi:hypothetical protein